MTLQVAQLVGHDSKNSEFFKFAGSRGLSFL
jgi:hypothetical protein